MDNPGTGTLLIADPFLKDPNFKRSVIFLCEHHKEGSFGFLLNRRYEHPLKDLVVDAEGLDLPVYFGGPVQTDTIHFLHEYPEIIDGGFEVMDGIYWGGDFEHAIAGIRAGQIDPEKIRFYIGYSGWSGGQLDNEMKEKSWLSVKANRKLLFHRNSEEVWKDSIRQLGGNYLMLINFPNDPQLN